MTFKHKLCRLKKLDLSILIHDVIKSLITKLLTNSELLQSPNFDLVRLCFCSFPNLILKNLFIN